MTAVVEVEGLTKTYPGNPPVRALRGIEFSVKQSELVAIVGPSGSGKSTLLHILGTLDQATAGNVLIAGRDIGDLGDREISALRGRHIGFLFQQFHLLNGYTALDNVADGLLYRGIRRAERRQLATAALERVGLSHRARHVASKLSGGERQRVAVARAIVGRPDLVLADEPTGNLDTWTSDSIVDLLEELNREGTTMLVITHNPEIAARFPRSITMRDGLIESDSTKLGVA